MGKSYSAISQKREDARKETPISTCKIIDSAEQDTFCLEPGNASGISHIYTRYRKELCDYITAKCQCSHDEVEDIVQTAFIRFSTLRNPEAVRNPRAFLFKTAYNIAIDNIRHSKVKDDYAHNTGQTHYNQTNELSPEVISESRQSLGIIAKALWHMPSKRRELLIMNRFDNLSYAEISRRVGLSETVVRKHVARALVDCHKALEN